MPFQFKHLEISEVVLVEAKSFPDERGFFMESFRESFFRKNGIDTRFVQDNCSHSVKRVLRGLHYQKNPMAQAKLVMAIRGEIFDVAVDIRKGSQTYGRWVGEVLSDQNHHLLYVPRGFAHGFMVLSDEADVLYKVDAEYSPEHEQGIIWNDPSIGIKWPFNDPVITQKDLQLPEIEKADNNFEYI